MISKELSDKISALRDSAFQEGLAYKGASEAQTKLVANAAEKALTDAVEKLETDLDFAETELMSKSLELDGYREGAAYAEEESGGVDPDEAALMRTAERMPEPETIPLREQWRRESEERLARWRNIIDEKRAELGLPPRSAA